MEKLLIGTALMAVAIYTGLICLGCRGMALVSTGGFEAQEPLPHGPKPRARKKRRKEDLLYTGSRAQNRR